MTKKQRRQQTPKPKSTKKFKRGNLGAEPKGERYNRKKDRWA